MKSGDYGKTELFTKVRTYNIQSKKKVFFKQKKTKLQVYFKSNVYVLSCFAFGKGRRSLSTEHEIRWFLISGTSNRASMGDFPSRISAAYAMANAPQLKPSSCF